MKLVYKGKYKEEAQLPVREHPEGYVPFKEPQSMKKLAAVANGIALGILIVLAAIYVLRCKGAFADFDDFMDHGFFALYGGMILFLLSLFPHELLHALCFRDEVQLYTNLKQGMLFVVGTEDMSRGRFVFMSLLPNIVFGLIPFLIAMAFPRLTLLGGLGVTGLSGGAGDFMNVFNCLTQVPKGAKVYMSGLHSYWYQA